VENIDIEIKKLLKSESFNIMEFCKRIGLTHAGYQYSIEKESLKVKTLIKISEVLNVHPGIFFEDTKYNQVNENLILYGKRSAKQASAERFNHLNLELEKMSIENEYLKKQIEDKNEIINLLKKDK